MQCSYQHYTLQSMGTFQIVHAKIAKNGGLLKLLATLHALPKMRQTLFQSRWSLFYIISVFIKYDVSKAQILIRLHSALVYVELWMLQFLMNWNHFVVTMATYWLIFVHIQCGYNMVRDLHYIEGFANWKFWVEKFQLINLKSIENCLKCWPF